MFSSTMTEMLASAIAFPGLHFLLSNTVLRDRLVAALGNETRFRGLFSLFAATSLIWLIFSYRNAPFLPLWQASPGMWHGVAALMPAALILFAGGLRKDNPPPLGSDPGAVDIARLGIFAVTRHPMMWGIGLWAALHLLVNGDAASALFFGAFLILALPGTAGIDAKMRKARPAEWRSLAAVTSNLPFAATLAGRNRLGLRGLMPPVAMGLLLYAGLLALHPWLFGVSPLPP